MAEPRGECQESDCKCLRFILKTNTSVRDVCNNCLHSKGCHMRLKSLTAAVTTVITPNQLSSASDSIPISISSSLTPTPMYGLTPKSKFSSYNVTETSELRSGERFYQYVKPGITHGSTSSLSTDKPTTSKPDTTSTSSTYQTPKSYLDSNRPTSKKAKTDGNVSATVTPFQISSQRNVAQQNKTADLKNFYGTNNLKISKLILVTHEREKNIFPVGEIEELKLLGKTYFVSENVAPKFTRRSVREYIWDIIMSSTLMSKFLQTEEWFLFISNGNEMVPSTYWSGHFPSDEEWKKLQILLTKPKKICISAEIENHTRFD